MDFRAVQGNLFRLLVIFCRLDELHTNVKLKHLHYFAVVHLYKSHIEK